MEYYYLFLIGAVAFTLGLYYICLRILSVSGKSAEALRLSQDHLQHPIDVGDAIAFIRSQTEHTDNGILLDRGFNDSSGSASKRRFNEKRFIEISKRRGCRVSGTEMGVLAGSQALHKYLAIDDHVYAGVERFSGESIGSIADLSAKLQTYESGFWSGLPEGTINSLAGHIGEGYAAEYLEKAGVSVEWPLTSTQPGWDLLVNGHEVNVKLYQNASNLSQHFARYPDIPVIIPGDAQNIPDGAIRFDVTDGIGSLQEVLSDGGDRLVLVSEDLSHADILSQVENSSGMLVGGENAVGADLTEASMMIPIFTLIYSGTREAKLLKEKHTELTTSIKNVGLDVLGTGVGGVSGAKAGAFLGTTVFPGVGTVVGALLGGIGGAIGGRFLSNGIKEGALHQAVKELKQAKREMKTAINLESKRASVIWSARLRAQQGVVSKVAKQQQAHMAREITSLRRWRVDAERIPKEESLSLINSANEALHALRKRLERNRSELGLWDRWVWPSAKSVSIDLALDTIELSMQGLNRCLEETLRSGAIDRGQLYEALSKTGVSKQKILQDLADVEYERQAREGKVLGLLSDLQVRVFDQRMYAMRALTQFFEEKIAEIRAAVKPKMEATVAKYEAARSEAAKLGRK